MELSLWPKKIIFEFSDTFITQSGDSRVIAIDRPHVSLECSKENCEGVRPLPYDFSIIIRTLSNWNIISVKQACISSLS